MDIDIVSTSSASAAIGPCSRGIRVGNKASVSGLHGIVSALCRPAGRGMKSRVEQMLRNITALLHTVGATPTGIAEPTIPFVTMTGVAAVNEVYGRFFDDVIPVRARAVAHPFPPDGIVDIDVIAAA